jgi:amino acid permease
MPISNSMSVVAMVNGMIGGIILVMPILSIRTGWALIAPITIIMGFFSYFSCLLCLRHLRNYPDLDVSVLRHFDNKRGYKIFYDVIIVLGMSALLMEYFKLISDQWYSMIAENKLIPIFNAIILFPIVYIMRKFDFGASLLGYGVLSIIGKKYTQL